MPDPCPPTSELCPLKPAQIREAGAIARQCTRLLIKDRKRRARERKTRERAKKQAAQA